MACSLRCANGSGYADDVSSNADIYDSVYEDELHFFNAINSNDEQENIEDNFFTGDENLRRQMIFVDGNDEDRRVCEYEDTLMERVWRSSKPPKIPKKMCVVPVRRIQITRERLSPTVKGLPTLKKSPSVSGVNTRHKIKSAVKYEEVNGFEDDEKKVSCQKTTITIVPRCAKRLNEYL